MLRAMATIDVRPVTRETWGDFVRLFEARGGPHYCWCAPYRFRDAQHLTSAQKKVRMEELVTAGTPIGVLAYDGGAPVGWCSIGPRETYVKLERSKVMPRKTPPETATWTVLCFYVARSHRGTGVARSLLRGAVAYARAQGAKVVEGYPSDTSGLSSRHHGHSSVFKPLRFRQDEGDRRWALSLGRSRR